MDTKVIVITGATRGLGRSLVPRFAAEGHTVIGCGRDAMLVAELQKAFPASHSFAAVDVCDAKAVTAWADAWSRQDVEAYLGAYAPDFQTPGGQSRDAWESQRRDRVAAPKSISVKVEAPRARAADGGRVRVTFRQHYRSDLFSGSSTKTLLLARSDDGRWRIVQERVGQ